MKLRYCCECDYAISDVEYEYAIADLTCPRCGQCKFSNFYGAGSDYHKRRLEEHMNHGARGNPPPWPEGKQ
jgi:hypothetical protein